MNQVHISKEIQFDAGHRVPNHESKCKNPHGHRYRVVAHCLGPIVSDPTSPDDGMLVDFGILKSWLTEHVHDVLDHGFIVHEDDEQMLVALGQPLKEDSDNWKGFDWKVIEFPYVPTAENIARWCYERLQPIVADHFRDELRLMSIEVWETPTSMATYPGVPYVETTTEDSRTTVSNS